MDTKDQTTRDIHILSCIFAGVRKYFRRVYQRDMFLSAVDSDTQPFHSHLYRIPPTFYKKNSYLNRRIRVCQNNLNSQFLSCKILQNFSKFLQPKTIIFRTSFLVIRFSEILVTRIIATSELKQAALACPPLFAVGEKMGKTMPGTF